MPNNRQSYVLHNPHFMNYNDHASVSSHHMMDQALEDLQIKKEEWAVLDINERISILNEILQDFRLVADDWVEAGIQAKRLPKGSFGAGEEWLLVAILYRLIRSLRQSLTDIRDRQFPRVSGPITVRPNGQVAASVFPRNIIDRLVMNGISAEVWMDPSVALSDGVIPQASFHTKLPREGKVALVLGAGNISALTPSDCLYKLFVEGRVVILKPNPVNAYLGTLIERAFQSLIRRGYMRVVYGGAEEGTYLCRHPAVEELHLTGTARAFDTITFGPGPEGVQRKLERNPLIQKRFTAELSNLTPIIVIPGPWNDRDIRSQGEKIASWLAYNAGFNCLTPRMIIQHKSWQHRDALNQAIGNALSKIETRAAYYPGAKELHAQFLKAHPDARQYGTPCEDHLPWTFIINLDPKNANEICFQQEAFCSLFAETAIEADDIPEFIDRAVSFANQKLWGTLTSTIVIHPESINNPKISRSIDQAIENLHYGTIIVNHSGGIGYYLSLTPWGGYPGRDIYDIQSGSGFVNNALMFDHPNKSVVRTPFKPLVDPFLVTSRRGNEFFKKLADYEFSPSLLKIPGILWTAFRN